MKVTAKEVAAHLDMDLDRFVKSLESYANECRKSCRETLFVNENLVAFVKCCLNSKELDNFELVVAENTTANKDTVPFLIKVIAEEADSIFSEEDVVLANAFQSVDWDGIVNSEQTKNSKSSILNVNVMFDDTDENVSKYNWRWADSYIQLNIPINLSEKYAATIQNLELGEDGSWSSYLRLDDGFSRKNDIWVETLEEKKELLEMYRLMNKFLMQYEG